MVALLWVEYTLKWFAGREREKETFSRGQALDIPGKVARKLLDTHRLRHTMVQFNYVFGQAPAVDTVGKSQ